MFKILLLIMDLVYAHIIELLGKSIFEGGLELNF